MFSLLGFRQNPLLLAAFFLIIFINSLCAAPSLNLLREKNTEALLDGLAVIAIVSLDDQTISLFDKKGNKIKTRISSGQVGYETPVGIFSVLQKEEEHYSNLYDDAAMPFMQRITWSGLSLHAGDLPGYPASHGCVRLPLNFAEKIFGLTRLGMRVIVARNEVTPSSLIHPALFQPDVQKLEPEDLISLPPFLMDEGLFNETLMPDVQSWPIRYEQQQHLKKKAYLLNLRAKELEQLLEVPKSKVEDLTHQRDEFLKKLKQTESLRKNSEKSILKVENLFKRSKSAKDMTAASNTRFSLLEKQARVDLDIANIRTEIHQANEALEAANSELNLFDAKYQKALSAANEAKLSLLPISVLVSLKTQRVYVRQGLEQIMEAEIAIENPEQPIGTHIYTALDYDESGKELQWNVVSLPKSEANIYQISYSDNVYTKKKSHNKVIQADLRDAVVALQRVQFPPELKKRVSEFVWPGSSLIITDEEPHKETGKATEFIVVVSGEPQGGLIKRPRWTPYSNYNSFWSALFNSGDEDDRRRAERERRKFEKEVRRLEKKRQRYWYD